MQYTNNYNLKKPDLSDAALITDINDNMDTIDEELAASTGDLANAKIKSSTASTASYPVPAANDTMKVMLGKIIKFCADIVQTFTGATASAAGHKGLVPAPAAGRNTYYLRGDGTWQAPVNGSTATAAGFSLDARQANPNVSGSLGAKLKSLNDSFLNDAFYRPHESNLYTDLNSYTKRGMYRFTNSPAHSPLSYGLLVVFDHGEYYGQLLFGQSEIYFRFSSGTTFPNPWYKLTATAQ